MKIQKRIIFFWGGPGGGGGGGLGWVGGRGGGLGRVGGVRVRLGGGVGQGGCERRIEVFVKIKNQSRTNGPINAHLTIDQV